MSTIARRIKWWNAPKDEVALEIFKYVESLEASQSWVRYTVELNERLYTNRTLDGATPAYAELLGGQDIPNSPENYLAAVTDTYGALVGSNRPLMNPQTNAALWRAQTEAKKLKKFIMGQFDKHKVYRLGYDAVMNSAVDGMAIAKIFIEDDEPQVELVKMEDLIVDEREARNSPPQQLHHRRWIDRDQLKAIYPKFADEIEIADESYGSIKRRERHSQQNPNSIPIIESWRLPTGKGKNDGRHCVAIRNTVLSDKKYSKQYFPFEYLYCRKPLRGFYGQGIVEKIAQLQIEINEDIEFVKECHRLTIYPRVYGDFGAKIPVEAMTNEAGLYINTRGGKPPTFYTAQALNAETYDWLERKITKMFKVAGVSEMIANARKEPGVQAGIAIREVNDIQSGRFAPEAQALEDFYIGIAKQLIWCTQDLEKAGHEMVSEYKERNTIKTIKWKEIDIGGDNFDISIEASNILNQEVAGRVSKAMDMLKLGAIDVQEFRHLIVNSDIDRTLEEEDSPRAEIEAVIEQLMDGKWEQPDPIYQDLQLGITMVRNEGRRISRLGAPEEIIDLFTRWIGAAILAANPPQPVPPVTDPASADLPTKGSVTQSPIAPAPPIPSAIPEGS